MSQTSSSTRTPRRRRLLLPVALGAIAILGVGAAVTVAAWTDDAWFGAQADTASIELYGANAEATACPAAEAPAYEEADTVAAAVEIPVDPFSGLGPDETVAQTICLWNGSDLDLDVALTPPDLTTDALFGEAASDPATLVVATDAAGATPFTGATIAADATLTLYVVVTTPDWVSPANDDMQGVTSGTIALQFTGTTP